MFVNYLKIAFRNLWRNRLQTIICLIGLSIGMTCFSLSTLWLRYIESFEDFVPEGDKVYYVTATEWEYIKADEDPHYTQEASVGFLNYIIMDPVCLLNGLSKVCPEIKETCIVRFHETVDLITDDKRVESDNATVNNNFFDFYGIQPYSGTLVLNQKEMVMTRQKAMELYNTEDVLGKTCIKSSFGNNTEYTIVGLVEEWPSNTQFHFDTVILHEILDDGTESVLGSLMVRLHEGTDVEALMAKTDSLTLVITNFWGPDKETTVKAFFTPLRKLRTDFSLLKTKTQSSYVLVFAIVSWIIILCALFNFFVTSISQIRVRSRILALRSLFGASKFNLMMLTMAETLLVFLLAALSGAFITWMILPIFVEYSEIPLSTADLAGRIICYIILVAIFVLLLSALATYITLRTTQKTILHGHKSHNSSTTLDRIANIIQLTVSIVVLLCTVEMFLQFQYMNTTKDIGFSRENRGVVQNADEAIKQYISESPLVDEYHVLPGGKGLFYNSGVNLIDEDQYGMVYSRDITPQMVDFWDMQIIEGEYPRLNEVDKIAISESLAKKIVAVSGNDTILGKTLTFKRSSGSVTVSGVVKNALERCIARYSGEKIESFPYNTMVYFAKEPEKSYIQNIDVVFRTKEGRFEEMMTQLRAMHDKDDSETTWNIVDISAEHTKNLTSERLLFELLLIVSLTSITIAILSVYSLISLSLEQRKKEIALRKIHGATPNQVLVLFFKSHFWLLLIASVIAFPIGFIVMNKWLQNFYIQITTPLWLVPAIFLTMAAIIFFTISWCVSSTVKQDPSYVIKNE